MPAEGVVEQNLPNEILPSAGELNKEALPFEPAVDSSDGKGRFTAVPVHVVLMYARRAKGPLGKTTQLALLQYNIYLFLACLSLLYKVHTPNLMQATGILQNRHITLPKSTCGAGHPSTTSPTLRIIRYKTLHHLHLDCLGQPQSTLPGLIAALGRIEGWTP